MPNTDSGNGAPLDERLKQYHEAIESEFKLATDPSPQDLSTIRKNAAEAFLAAVPQAVKRILYLMEHADKENIQFGASKFVVQSALSQDSTDAADPLTQLLKELNDKAQAQKAQASTQADDADETPA
jgi:hypothetical protein